MYDSVAQFSALSILPNEFPNLESIVRHLQTLLRDTPTVDDDGIMDYTESKRLSVRRAFLLQDALLFAAHKKFDPTRYPTVVDFEIDLVLFKTRLCKLPLLEKAQLTQEDAAGNSGVLSPNWRMKSCFGAVNMLAFPDKIQRQSL